MAQILAAFGTHPHATSALRWAARLADRTGDDLVAVNVFDRSYSEMSPDRYDDLMELRTGLVAKALHEVTTRSPEIEVLEGDPHPTLAARADRDDVDYVVVGQHGVDLVGALGGGGTAHHLIHHISRPVAVVGEQESLDSGPVIVGVDGSSTNARAVEVAEHLAKQLSSEVIAVFCPDVGADSYPHAPGFAYLDEDATRAELQHHLHSGCELLIEPGHPTETLGRVAKERGATAIVVGTRGRGGFHGLIAGHVPTQLLRHAPVPVIVVPHAG